MAQATSIEWCDAVWNFLRGCSRVSEGCRNCYAEGIAARFSGPGMPYEGLAKFVDHKPRWTGELSFVEDALVKPLHWTKPRKVFVNSMSDLFHENVKNEWLDRAFAVMALTPQHTYQILTKRPERMRDYLTRISDPAYWGQICATYEWAWTNHTKFGVNSRLWPFANVWLGVSVEDQKTADERIPLLLDTPAAVRWLSIEPLLGPIDIGCFLGPLPERFLNWAVCGGESGPNARPMNPDWVRSLRDQCVDADVPFFFKQWGEYAPNWLNDADNKIPGSEWIDRMGKKVAGRELDGRTWDEFPITEDRNEQKR